jgi:hypothetical protein
VEIGMLLGRSGSGHDDEGAEDRAAVGGRAAAFSGVTGLVVKGRCGPARGLIGPLEAEGVVWQDAGRCSAFWCGAGAGMYAYPWIGWCRGCLEPGWRLGRLDGFSGTAADARGSAQDSSRAVSGGGDRGWRGTSVCWGSALGPGVSVRVIHSPLEPLRIADGTPSVLGRAVIAAPQTAEEGRGSPARLSSAFRKSVVLLLLRRFDALCSEFQASARTIVVGALVRTWPACTLSSCVLCLSKVRRRSHDRPGHGKESEDP